MGLPSISNGTQNPTCPFLWPRIKEENENLYVKHLWRIKNTGVGGHWVVSLVSNSQLHTASAAPAVAMLLA